MNYLNDIETKKELEDYIFNVNIKYAILLNGDWGSGKTHFIKEYITELMENKKTTDTNKNIIYVSLYGMNNISEIKEKILFSLISNTDDKGIQKLIPIINIGAKYLRNSSSEKSIFTTIRNSINKLIETISLNDLVIFFDDLERCTININTILGYINDLVEHNDTKVIILADENKIGKMNYQNNLELKYLTALSNNLKDELTKNDDYKKSLEKEFTKQEIKKRAKYIFDENETYNEIKEKVIGKVINFRANINTIYDYFLENILKNEEAKETAKRMKEDFLDLLEFKKYNNLRTIQFIFQSFDRLVRETINIIDSNIKDQYLDDLFYYCAYISLQIKQGNKPHANDFEFLQIRRPTFLNSITEFKFVDNYLTYSYINQDEIKIKLNNYVKIFSYEISNKNDPLYKLQKWHIIPEQDLIPIIDDLIKKIEENDYDLELYSKIVLYLSNLESINICKDKVKIALKKLNENITKGIVKGTHIEDDPFFDSPLYNENMKKIKQLANELKEKRNNAQLDIIYSSDKWGEIFKEYCKKNEGTFLEDKEFALYLKIDKIVENISKKDIDQIYEFLYGLQKIYNSSNIKEYYKNDILVLKELEKDLYSIKDDDKIRLFAIEKVTNYLKKIITILDN